MTYEYYYGPEAEQFSFYRIPKVLFEAESVRDLSTEAKLLYGMMLDRMQLSARNKWLDDKGRVFIYFTVNQIMKALSLSNKTVIKLLSELETAHLITREKGGFSKPDRIYVMNFLSVVYKLHPEKCKNYTDSDVKTTPTAVEKVHPNNTDINNTEISDNESSSAGDGSLEAYRYYDSYIRERICFDSLVSGHPYKRDELEEIVALITDVMTTRKGLIRVNGDDKPVAVVKSRMMTLDSTHIEYVLECLENRPEDVRNMRGYLLSLLFTAPTTISNYYSAQVKYDMAKPHLGGITCHTEPQLSP
ncbi:MAG: replication initiator protein A [Lachnospiraceae bacterium]|nr:replication initiator protein A [Lachnospiraceae bacterium]